MASPSSRKYSGPSFFADGAIYRASQRDICSGQHWAKLPSYWAPWKWFYGSRHFRIPERRSVHLSRARYSSFCSAWSQYQIQRYTCWTVGCIWQLSIRLIVGEFKTPWTTNPSRMTDTILDLSQYLNTLKISRRHTLASMLTDKN